MEKIESIWRVSICSNQVQFIGMALKIHGTLEIWVERALLLKAINYIEQAERFAEVVPISKEPEDFTVNDSSTIVVGFTLMFKTSEEARMFLEELKK